MDFMIWPILKSDVSDISYSRVSSLKEALGMLWYNLSKDVVKKLCTSAEKRLRAIVKVKGDHFEL